VKTLAPVRVAGWPRIILKLLLCSVTAALWAIPGTVNATLRNYPNTPQVRGRAPPPETLSRRQSLKPHQGNYEKETRF
jgi:hypothetical protein